MNSETDATGTGQPDRDAQNRLDAVEVRVLAVLAEKEALTPDTYPMSLNALVNGCNQLSSRDPVMTLSEQEVQQTLQRLMDRKLVTEVRQAGARVAKYEHRMRVKWTLEQDKLAVLAILMLRGVQTAGEIRARSGRLHEFSTVAEAESALQFLIDKFPPLAARLARAPGTKEARYAHLLCGDEILERQEAAAGAPAAGVPTGIPSGAQPSRQDRVAQLEEEVARLRSEVDSLAQQFEHFKKQFD